MTTPTMLEATRKMMADRPRRLYLKTISEETGLPFFWLQSFVRTGSPKNPGVDKVETLFKYLTKIKNEQQ